MNKEDDLLMRLAEAAGCAYLSDLHYLSDAQRKRVHQMVTNMKVEEAELNAWNEALSYLGHFGTEQDSTAAREKLLSVLSIPGET